ncbi:MAG: hypothetical protein ACXVYY_01115 [Oryzihumus sp.]
MRTREQIDADIEALHAAQDRYNRRTVNKGGPMQQEAHWRRYCADLDALRAERDALVEDEDDEVDYDPPDACGLCGMRRAEPGHTACSTCA